MGILLLMSSTHHSTRGERNVYDAWTILQLLNIRRRALAIDVLTEKGAEVQYWKNRIDELVNATTCKTCNSNLPQKQSSQNGELKYCKECKLRDIMKENRHDVVWPLFVQTRTHKICGTFLQLKAITDGESREDLSNFLELTTEASLKEFFSHQIAESSPKSLNHKITVVQFIKDPIEDAQQHLLEIVATVKSISAADIADNSTALKLNEVEQYHKEQISLCLSETKKIMEWFRSSESFKNFNDTKNDGYFLEFMKTTTVLLDSCHFAFDTVVEENSCAKKENVYRELTDVINKMEKLCKSDDEKGEIPYLYVESPPREGMPDKPIKYRFQVTRELVEFGDWLLKLKPFP